MVWLFIFYKITSRSYLLVPKDSPILHRLKLSLTSSTLTSHQRKGHCWFWGKCSFLCSNVYSHTKLANTCSTNGFDLIVWSTAVKTWSSRSSHSSPTEKETLLASAVVPVLTMHQHGVKPSSTDQPESGDSDKGRRWSDLIPYYSLFKGYSPNRSGPRQWSDLGLIKVTTKLWCLINSVYTTVIYFHGNQVMHST